MGAMFIRMSLSPLHVECETLMDEMHEDPTNFISGICNWLLSIGENGVYTDRMIGVHDTHRRVSVMYGILSYFYYPTYSKGAKYSGGQAGTRC